MNKIPLILDSYRQLLKEVDDWFGACLHAGGSQLGCRSGCSACCRGLFDITLLDAWLLWSAYANLPVKVQQEVLGRCQPRLAELSERWPDLHQPYILNTLPEEDWLNMPEDDQTPCPLLDSNGRCLVYAARPITCRLHGLPNIDISGEDFDGVVCSLHDCNPNTLPNEILHWRFREVFVREAQLFRLFTAELVGAALPELDTFIPLALLSDYATTDWSRFKF